MAVYVDDTRNTFGRMKMCHMVADTSEELHAMAQAIGMKRSWCQNEGARSEHYDVNLTRKRDAVARGAIEITQRQLGRMLLARKHNDNPERRVCDGQMGDSTP